MNDFIIGVAGNPNCGKTTMFNALTGAKQRVGNWPGVTVDRKVGNYRHGSKEVEVVDLPGIYSLAATSVDEEVARDYILSGEPDLIVNIVDASNLERNLYLTSQLLEMKIPMLVVLNMMDIAKSRNIEINIPGLAEKLGCPVIPIVAAKNEGTETLKTAINKASKEKSISATEIVYPLEIQEAVKELIPVVEEAIQGKKADANWVAVKLLEGDKLASEMVGNYTDEIAEHHRKDIENKLGEEPDIVVADTRYGFINDLTRDLVKKASQVIKATSDKIDHVVLNRVMGIPIFLVVMYLMFMFTINFGGAFIDFFDIFAGTIFVDGFGKLLGPVGTPEWLVTILAGGVGGAIQTMATFIPPIGCMFLCLSFLEDSGYMARAAFVMDRFMRFIGLPGKSFIPMLVGFGCNVPAIMATRTLENQRDRTLTIMMNPFMSCGARLPVYALFAAAFFPVGGQNLVFGLYLIGIGFAVLTGLILKNTLLKGDITPFVMELPPYHMPTVRGILLRTWDRLKTFMFRAGRVLVPVIVVLSFMNSMGTDGTFGNEDSEKSVLANIGKSITPIFRPMGIVDDNWPATVGIFTGLFAKEAVVGTLDSLYSQIDAGAGGGEEGEEAFDFWGGIVESFATIPANLGDLAGSFLDPLGLSVGDVGSIGAAAEEQEVSFGTFGSMATLFAGKIGAFAYLLFILLYFPCAAAIAAVYRETNLKWTVFAGAWTTGLAYMASSAFYQLATFGQHPASSLTWVGIEVLVFAIIFFIMRYLGQEDRETESALAAAKA
ncbi:MAG: Fe(2+) transporter permease subunit FeoB [Deltaproteobacteria bacterium]|nr:Fe(2+) transporter permease subunit FeoB [Deltaproteobacteria bacterium]MDL1961104.1 Fe(2+) transporter permease subunit FeoB [Deltaproteobacteria bacterium]